MGKRGKRFIPRITTVREWSTGPDGPNGLDGPNGSEEPTLVIETPGKEILTIAQGETLFQIDRLNSEIRNRHNFLFEQFYGPIS